MDSSTLKPGLSYEFKFKIPENKTVPFLYPEASEFQVMPRVFATGFMVGLFEWTCIQAINPYLDWPSEQTVGTDVKLSHSAATPPGLIVTVKIKLEKIEGRKLTFSIIADDGVEKISEGTHERFIINAAKFNAKAEAKADRAEAKADRAEAKVDRAEAKVDRSEAKVDRAEAKADRTEAKVDSVRNTI